MQLEMKAKHDAEGDVKQVGNTAWGIGAFLASAFLSPLIGGGATIIAAYTMGGDVKAPASRIGEINQTYPDNYTAVKAYEDQHTETYKSLKRKGQGKAAWIGTGAGVVLNLLIISALLAD